MSVLLFLMVLAGAGLLVSVFLIRRGVRQDFDEATYGTEEEEALASPWDPLVSELSAGLFNSKDSEFVRLHCSPKLARRFRAERTALALDWLVQIRRQVNLLTREHVRAARSDSDLKPADELRLGFEFLLFQVSSGVLYLIIWMFGPPRASRLVGYPIDLAQRLRKMTDDLVPGGAQVAAELLDIEPPVNRGTSAP